MSRKLLRYPSRQANQARQQLSGLPAGEQAGFTIIESLLAIVVVAILMTAIAPMIVLSVGTRLQARRVELATQAARAYVDSVRSGTIVPPEHSVYLAESTNATFTSQRSSLANENAPASGTLTCPSSTVGYPYCTNTTTSSLYCIDSDGDGGCTNTSPRDFVVQAFRSRSVSTAPTTEIDKENENNKGFVLSVRVYRADAFRDANPIFSSAGCQNNVATCANNQQRQATVTSGLGQRKAPLVVLTTEIATNQTKFRDFCDRLGGCQ